MTRSVFFVQNNYVERLTAPVARYAHARGIDLVDRSSHADFDADACGVDWSAYDLVLPYGSVQFLRRCKASSLGQFVLHDENRFAAATWMPILKTSALNGGGRLLSVAALMQDFGQEALHLRPDSVDKAFVGAVHTQASFATLVAEKRLAGNLLCWASPLKDIAAEWRCWIIGGDLVEVSQYRQDGSMAVQRETSTAIWSQARALAALYQPAPCVVMDMALVGNAYSVVEYNPIHCSGWYAANVDVVLDAWVAWAESALRQAPSGECRAASAANG